MADRKNNGPPRGVPENAAGKHSTPACGDKAASPLRVALFATCLVDFFRPSVGFAALKLLKDAGCHVTVPGTQSCCGQPNYNSGDFDGARALARKLILEFEDFQYIVAPSGSCAGMLKHHYGRLFHNQPRWRARAREFSRKVHELTRFLDEICKVTRLSARHCGTVTYHDSCAGLRELDIFDQPRNLLRKVEGVKLVELQDNNVCCGFGGTFCIKYGEVSNAIVDKKASCIEKSGADLLLAGDMGCLLNMAGKLSRRKCPVAVRHVAEILAGMTEEPPIGQGAGGRTDAYARESS